MLPTLRTYCLFFIGIHIIPLKFYTSFISDQQLMGMYTYLEILFNYRTEERCGCQLALMDSQIYSLSKVVITPQIQSIANHFGYSGRN